MGMLGSINTGGFSKSQVDAMKDSNYFTRKGVAGVYDPINPNAPVETGSFSFLKNFASSLPKVDTDEQGKSFLDRFQSYRPREESGQEKFYGALAENLETGKGFAAPVTENLTVVDKPKGKPIKIAGQQGSGGIGSGIAGAAGGYLQGGPLGAVIGGIGGLFCDVRVKEDIAPLQKSEVNDLLSECAFFVKDLNECS